MKPAFVLDCSLSMSWCFSEEATKESIGLLKRLDYESALVPSLWFLEVTNILALAEKRGRITTWQVSDFLFKISLLNLVVDYETSGRAFSYLLPLCRSHGLTSYDAVYLDLALRSGLPLASLDKDLRACARLHQIEVLGL